MKNLLLTIALFICSVVSAQYKAPEKAQNSYVTDLADILTTDQEKSLNILVDRVKRQSSVEMAIVTLNSLDGYPIEDVALTIGRSWGVGKAGINNGLLYVICPKERTARLEVGPGLQGILTDAETNRLQDEIKPFYRKEQYFVGMFQMFSKIEQILSPEYAEQQALYKKQQEQKAEETKRSLITFLYWLLGVLFSVSIVVFVLWFNKRQLTREKELQLKKALDASKLEKYRVLLGALAGKIKTCESRIESVLRQAKDNNLAQVGTYEKELASLVIGLKLYAKQPVKTDPAAAWSWYENVRGSVSKINNLLDHIVYKLQPPVIKSKLPTPKSEPDKAATSKDEGRSRVIFYKRPPTRNSSNDTDYSSESSYDDFGGGSFDGGGSSSSW